MITLDDYHELMADRPEKFTQDEVGYSATPRYDQVCGECVHYFRNPATRHTTCEIMRPSSDTENVSHVGWCYYWTGDYKTFPLLHLAGETS